LEIKVGSGAMTDNHIHIGQFEDVYYEPQEITEIVMSAGMEGLAFSSTTSCVENIRYAEVEKEILNFLKGISLSPEIIRPFFWYVPDYIDQGVNIQGAFNAVPYKGIKIHPYINNWDFNDNRHMEMLYSLFDYAAKNSLPVLIHTGHSGVDSADRFERFINEYGEARCILAHCRPLDVTVRMLGKYNNVFCDTAFVPEEDIRLIIHAGYGEKIIFGTDFPVTHYFNTNYPQEGEKSAVTLREQYPKDMQMIDILNMALPVKRTDLKL
jgi:predicted TIM-barrel fold metal-dependent hydrolase